MRPARAGSGAPPSGAGGEARLMVGYAREYICYSAASGSAKEVAGKLARDTRALCKVLPGERLARLSTAARAPAGPIGCSARLMTAPRAAATAVAPKAAARRRAA